MNRQHISTATVRRLMNDIKYVEKNPNPLIDIKCDPNNMLIWYFIIEGSEETPFKGGFYLGKLLLDNQYPFLPPNIHMITPSGRFRTDFNICFSLTAHHPEKWSMVVNPSIILVAFHSFMNDLMDFGDGCLSLSTDEIKQFTMKTIEFNLQNKIVQELFPDSIKKMKNVQERNS